MVRRDTVMAEIEGNFLLRIGLLILLLKSETLKVRIVHSLEVLERKNIEIKKHDTEQQPW